MRFRGFFNLYITIRMIPCQFKIEYELKALAGRELTEMSIENLKNFVKQAKYKNNIMT